jgi:hypothetical protein
MVIKCTGNPEEIGDNQAKNLKVLVSNGVLTFERCPPLLADVFPFLKWAV